MGNALGIFGGRFDPVHYGHLHAAIDVRDALELVELRLLPARDPPHRGTPSATPAQRLAMLELALTEFPVLAIDARELSRTGKSYTIETLEELRAEMPTRAIVLVMGVDTFAALPSWHRWMELVDFAHIAVVTRPGASLDDVLRGPLVQLWQNRQSESRVQLETSPAGAIFRVAVTPYAISATALRRALARGRAGIEEVRGLLPAAVLSYIETHHLYATGSDAS
ncbi:MAG TPA: nicotinate-nucleotide adenylyltransferase [Casimicrobiaceae bacterium]|nr:nicotinate-nucleotide adenylyltransferase [Casimicrobiaceae bacterium]